MQYASLLLALGGNPGNQVPKYYVTPAELLVLRLLHGDQSITDVDVHGELPRDFDSGNYPEELRPRTTRQEVERLRQIYSRQDGDVVVSPAVTALFGQGLGNNVPKSFSDIDLDESQFAVKERKTPKSDDQDDDDDTDEGKAKGYADMTVNQLRAVADKDGVDITGLAKKGDIIAALELNDENKKAAGGSVFE